MKIILKVLSLALLIATLPLSAHHAAQGTVDDEVWEMIDELVEDTPHANFVSPDEMPVTNEMIEGSPVASLTAPSLVSFERLIDYGLITYLWMLDGEVTLEIALNPPDADDFVGVEMYIYQD